ncbi:MAG: PD-(D/E)XK nuclease family protein [Bdellovibrionaceae bacterium]|nr:PD-(D/E)XK nuclease family protein [Pseudobdellovibrionaceae bacterium]
MNKIPQDSIYSFFDRLKHLKQFNSDIDIWVVSDLNLKKRIKALLLKDSACVHSGSVMRAQEFWQFLFKRLYPEFVIKEDFLITAMLRQFLSTNDLNGISNESYVKQLFAHICSFLPIFTSPQGTDYFSEWLKNNPDPHLEKWFYLSFKAWKYLLEKKIISTSFLPGILSADAFHLFSFLKGKKIIFDLGFQMQALEASCIKAVSKVTEVKVLSPAFHNFPEADTFLWVYKLLNDISFYQSHLKESDKKMLRPSSSVLKEGAKVSFVKYSNQLAEIRGIIKQVKKHLSQGVSLSNIAIVAPDIEYLWPVLSLQLKTEGIAFNKAMVSGLHANKTLMLWLARLRVALGSIAYADLEMVFAFEGTKDISYKDFKYHFSNTYSVENYQKTPWSKKLLTKPISKSKEINLLEFLDWAFSFWRSDKEKPEGLDLFSEGQDNKQEEERESLWKQVYKTLRQQGELSIKLSADSWLLYAQDLLSKKTQTLSKEEDNALSCYNISNSDHLEEEYIILSDLSFNALKNTKNATVSLSQALSVSEDLGISLDPSWGVPLEVILKYILQLKDKVIVCSWSAVNLESKEQVASAFFLEEYFRRNTEQLKLADILPTTFNNGDLHQISYKQKLEESQSDCISLTGSRILYDKNILPMQEVPIDIPSISITNIGRYTECPFIFFSEKILKLQENPDWDLDVDPLKKGSLFHKLLELIVINNTTESGDEELLFSKLNEHRKKELKIDDNSWGILQEQLRAITKNFIELEKQQKIKSPSLTTSLVEQPVKAFWSQNKKHFLNNDTKSLSSKKEGLLVSGKIDRLDSDEKNIFIRDYKTSVAGRTGVNTWKDKRDLSLFLYYRLWQASGKKQDCLGAVYLGINDLQAKGFWVKEYKDSNFLKSISARSMLDKESSLQLFKELDKEVESLINSILSGKFSPNPKDKTTTSKTCNKCKWSGLCRAADKF